MNYAKLYTLRSDGRYQGYWKDAEGKRHAICDRDPKQLYMRISEKQAPKVLTFGSVANRWHDWAQEIYKPGSWAMYEAPYQRALVRFGNTAAAELNSADISVHLAEMAAQGYGERSLKAQRTVYSLIYKYAAQQKDLVDVAKYNPASMAALPRNHKRPTKRKAPDDDAVTRILLGVNRSFGLFPYLLLCTGLRRGEALGLRWEDIDYASNLILVERGVTYRKGQVFVGDVKTEGSIREVPLLPMLAVVLKHYAEKDKTNYIFHGEDPKKPLSEATFRRRWHRWCRENGFAVAIESGRTQKRDLPHYKYEYNLTPHVLRHGYASITRSGGVDKELIKMLLGHENIRTTELYIHDLKGAHTEEYSAAAQAIEAKISSILHRKELSA